MVTIDVKRVFDVFEGPRGLLASLDRYQPGHNLSYNHLQMWCRRQAIPGKWVGAVLYCGECQGHACRDFLHDDDELGLAPRARSGG